MKNTLIIFGALLLAALDCYADIPRFQRVHPHFYRGGQPTELLDYQELKSLGIRTIINLRETPSAVSQERIIASKLGLKFLHVPISSALPPSKGEIKRVLEAINRPENQPVFLHCRHGEDRTGMAVGLYRFYFDGWSSNRGYQEMVDMGFKQHLLNLSGFYWLYTGLKSLY